MKKYLFVLIITLAPQLTLAATKTVILNTQSQTVQTWTVPADFQSLVSIHVIGAGGSGGNYTTVNAGGGGGGGYSKIASLSLTAGQSVSYIAGWGGGWNSNINSVGYSGGDTFFNGTSCAAASVCAKGGAGGGFNVGGAGGAAASGVGAVRYSGGAGSSTGGGGGGGAAGLNGSGNNGSGTTGGYGDAGSGGNGGPQVNGNGAGGSGSEFQTGYGSGGGGGTGGQGGSYGAGGGGGGIADVGGGPYGTGGGIAGGGIIVITYNTACVSTAGDHSIMYATSGNSCSFSVPTYGTLTVQLWGAGGSGSVSGFGGTNGGASTFNTVSAGGGATGQIAGGAGGVASGGTINTNGNPGAVSGTLAGSPGGNGGNAPNGGAGGVGQTSGTPSPGNAPGGGGGGVRRSGGGGGSGAYLSKTYVAGVAGSPAVGASIPIVVGAGGVYNGTTVNGASGQVTVTWTDPVACTITLSPTTVGYGNSSTLTWSSTNANTSMYINTIGYVAASGSTTVSPSTSTDYTGTAVGTGGTSTCKAAGTSPAGTLTVTPPSNPSTTITASSSAIYVGGSTGIKATFVAGSGDTLTYDNIDSPVGTGLGATINPDAIKYFTFTPSTPGTYTFYARAQTSYFTSWTMYNSVTVTVTNPPSCTPAYSCSGQTIQYTNNICQVSNITTCISPAFCSPGSSTCLNPAPTFNQSGNLTGHLQAIPLLVPQNTPATLYWNVGNVSSCIVSGSNTDSWTGTTSGSPGKTTLPIQQQTTFMLTCTNLDASHFSESQTVNVVPVFQER